MAQLFQSRDVDDQTNSLAHYLPTGELFEARFIEDSNLRLLLRGLASELQRYYSILEQAATEHDINYAQNLITEWESAVGIPGTCFDNTADIDTRRLHVLMKIHDLHGSTEADIINVAALLGFTVTIEHMRPHAIFPMQFPIYLFGSVKEALHTVIINLETTYEPDYFVLTFPIVFSNPSNALLQCIFDRMKPASVNIIYNYV